MAERRLRDREFAVGARQIWSVVSYSVGCDDLGASRSADGPAARRLRNRLPRTAGAARSAVNWLTVLEAAGVQPAHDHAAVACVQLVCHVGREELIV